MLTLSKNIFQEKDYLDGRFFHKRAFYLAALAAELTSKKDLHVEYNYDSAAMDTRLTTLIIRPRNGEQSVASLDHTSENDQMA